MQAPPMPVAFPIAFAVKERENYTLTILGIYKVEHRAAPFYAWRMDFYTIHTAAKWIVQGRDERVYAYILQEHAWQQFALEQQLQ